MNNSCESKLAHPCVWGSICAPWIVLLVLLSALPATVRAQFEYSNNFNGTATITGYTGPGGDVTIPDTIDGLRVTEIGHAAFSGCPLTTVVVGASVTDIGRAAFAGCGSLTGVYFVGNAPAFDPLDGVFYQDRHCIVYYMPGTTGWGTTYCGLPTALWGNPRAQDPFTYGTNNGTIAITGYYGPGGAVTIPGTINGLPVTSIGYKAFWLCTNLTSVTIPNSVTSIGDSAFVFTGLTSIAIPNSVTSIGYGAFADCYSLTSVIIPNSLTSMGDYAFDWCASLASVTIPNSVTNIGEGAFFNCTSLSSVTIGNGVTGIGDNAFAYCGLTSVAIPNSVTSIGDSAFYNCASLGGVYFAGNAPSLGGSSVFAGDDHATVYYLPDTTGWGTTYGGLPTAVWHLSVPWVSTLPAAGVSTNRATLNGTVNPDGHRTTAWFQWGTATQYGNLTAATGMGSGTTVLPLDAPLAGLTPKVTYHFRVAATNDYGLVYGSDQSFTTLGLPEVSTLPATGVSTDSATLNAMVNPNGWPTTAWFQWGGTTNYGNLSPVTDLGSGTTALPLFAPLAGLTRGVTYHFRVAATNDYGLACGSDQSFTTLAVPVGSALTYTVLKNFTGSDGWQPEGGLVLSGSTLYGTASGGGSLGEGVVFKMNTDGSGYTLLKNFAGSDGSAPVADLLLSGNTLYGTTDMGGNYDGVVFKMNTDGSGYTLLKNFTLQDGFALWGGLVLSGSTLYGTAAEGGGSGGNGGGVVFKVNTDGSGFAVLKFFTGSDGFGPYHGNMVLSGSTLYGTTTAGGSSFGSAGVVFKMNTDGSGYTVLKSFTGSDGMLPLAGLVLSGNTLYGTTGAGGSSYSSTNQGYGVVFKMNTDRSGYTVLKNFTGSDGYGPMADLVLSGSTLYGTTEYGGSAYNPPNNNGYGVVFMLNTDGSGYTVLKSFSGSDGRWPFARLVLAGSTLYGTTQSGGGSYNPPNNYGYGVVFELSLPFPTIVRPTRSQTAEAGSTAQFTVGATGSPPPAYQWYFDDTNAIGCTNACLELTDVQFSQSGAYTVVITNVAGAVTSAPAMLQVIAPVERTPVPGVEVTGATGRLLNVDYANPLSPAPNWTPLGSVSLTSMSQYYFDLTIPLPPQRFYRAWQTGTPGVRPSLDLHIVPAVTLTSSIGGSVRVDAINRFGPTDAWFTLDTVTLTNASQLYFDTSAWRQPQRLYRLVQVP